MIKWIVIIVIVCAIPVLRCLALHPIKAVYNLLRDVWLYIYHREYNKVKTGDIYAYVGLFGRGKTLSLVHRLVSLYKKYDGKTVYHDELKRFVKQRVVILSNVELDIPSYVHLADLRQIVSMADTVKQYDEEHNTYTVILVGIDEASVQFNSRNFRNNIDPLFLGKMLCCRHYHMSMYVSAQRYCQMDALLRQVTQYVIACNKVWRFQKNYYYDAWEVENATDTALLKPLRKSCWFVTNADYRVYNTFAVVDNLAKDCANKAMLTEEEILSYQRNTSEVNADGIIRPTKKYRRSRKRLR